MGNHKPWITVSKKVPHGLNFVRPAATKTKRKHVFVAIPCTKASLTTNIATLLCDTVVEGLTPGKKLVFTIRIINDYFPTEYARNVLCRDFLASDAELLWFIDSDTLPDNNWLKLFDVDEDIVAGVYPIGRQDKGNRVLALDWGLYKKAPEHEYGWMALPIEGYQKGEVIECDAAATGCMVIKRKVIEHFAKDAVVDEDKVPAIFRWPKKPSGKSLCSDDFDFCTRAQDAGFKLKVHTSVRWGHLKFKDLKDVYEQLKSAWMAGYEESMENEDQQEAVL